MIYFRRPWCFECPSIALAGATSWSIFATTSKIGSYFLAVFSSGSDGFFVIEVFDWVCPSILKLLLCVLVGKGKGVPLSVFVLDGIVDSFVFCVSLSVSGGRGLRRWTFLSFFNVGGGFSLCVLLEGFEIIGRFC